MKLDLLERRSKLLELEGNGFSQAEIVKQLGSSFHVSYRQIYEDFETRETWQNTVLSYKDSKQAYLRGMNRLEQIYRCAAFFKNQAQEERNRILALKIMLQTAVAILDRCGFKEEEPTVPSEIQLGWQDRSKVILENLKEYEETLDEAQRLRLESFLAKTSPEYTTEENEILKKATAIISARDGRPTGIH